MNRLRLSVCALAVCIFVPACDPIATEQVTVQLPSGSEAAAGKTAVALATEVLIGDGFSARSHSGISDNTIVAAFDGAGNLGCFVYRETGQVRIYMTEMGRFKSRPEAIRARADLKRKLAERFGQDKVGE